MGQDGTNMPDYKATVSDGVGIKKLEPDYVGWSILAWMSVYFLILVPVTKTWIAPNVSWNQQRSASAASNFETSRQ